MPDDAAGRALSNGRLNLEQQKKRAKELHRGLLSGEPSAVGRLASHHPKGGRLKPALAQLADAQLVLARENGFDSWPRMKAHTEALRAARDAAGRPELAPDTGRTLHIRCGSDIRQAQKAAGFVGAFAEFSDPFCQGPVRDLPFDDFIAERAAFVAAAFNLYPKDALRRLRGEYAVLDRLAAYRRIALWFEHDGYDQLILAYLLTALGDAPSVDLICADSAPAVADFVGLGQLAPEVIRLMWDARVAVGPEHVALGRRVWAALTAPSPEMLFEIAEAGTPAVPPMAGALMRHLRELPSTANGLSLSQQITLDALADEGPMTARALFARYATREPLPFLGDAMFWPVLADMAAGERPLIEAAPGAGHHPAWPGRTVSLTGHGQAVRRGDSDWLDASPGPRWIGGVVVRPGEAAWRWDGARPVRSA
jgi:hypothetical protein